MEICKQKSEIEMRHLDLSVMHFLL